MSSQGLALSIENLTFKIDDKVIINDIGFSIAKGELVGLIGPNGAGKTTLLKCLNGINTSTGKVKLGNKLLSELSEREIALNIAFMHQDTMVAFAFPSLDVVLMGRYPHIKRFSLEKKEDYTIARNSMEYTGTLHLEKRMTNSLSGGERQRVFFAKTLAQETPILLLDEPTASLDLAHQEQLFKYAAELCNEGKTIIAAVHDLKIAARYCTRLILMREGKVIADGSPEEVLTSENLEAAYGINAVVYKNHVTGQLDFFISNCDSVSNKGRAHVIGGGGSAAGVIRELFERGYKVTAGVLVKGDTDLDIAQVFGLEYIMCEPFCDVSEEEMNQNIELINDADLTVLCNMPFGRQNLRNLKAAKLAKKLLIIEDEGPEGRDFTGGEALQLYKEMRSKAVITTSARLHEVI